ncbi:ORC1-type DNA replication protein [Candidatus Woesearchaeota archaeon]|nr:ORC1-type DNA replication protein [Candidatus Woesearchaeota archaeon]
MEKNSKQLSHVFEKYMKNKPVFHQKQFLQSNYMPDTIEHRDKEINTIAEISASALRNEKPSNIFIYGKTGTGKTLTIQYTMNQLNETSQAHNIPLKILYINCKLKKIADTEYRIIAQLIRELGKEVPPTGLPTDEIYKIFINIIDQEQQIIILVLDEIDQLVKKAGDEILYNLTRLNTELKKAQISIIGISNDLLFSDNLDPRVKSSLSEEELIFSPYNALQLKSILKKRSDIAFVDGVIEQGLIEKCAAYAARDHGDARRALELLRVSGEIAEREGSKKVMISHLDLAESKIEKDRIIDLVSTQPKQHQIVLYSILKIADKRQKVIFTGEIYEYYKGICIETSIRPLTQRRVSDIIAEFDMLGLITGKIISKGRYGRTREVNLSIPDESKVKIKQILKDSLNV